MRVELCPACFERLERAPLALVKRILAQCPKCRHQLIRLVPREREQLLQASIVADALQRVTPRKARRSRRGER